MPGKVIPSVLSSHASRRELKTRCSALSTRRSEINILQVKSFQKKNFVMNRYYICLELSNEKTFIEFQKSDIYYKNKFCFSLSYLDHVD